MLRTPAKQQAAKAERKRRIEQKMANEKRCEQVQVITNAAKLKRLSKKKMRGIQKR